MRGLDAGVVVVDSELKVVAWNRWTENAWGLREEEAVGHLIVSLDIGLPVKQLEQPLRQAAANATPSESVVDALDRRGRTMKCRVRIAPLMYDDRSTRGAVIMLEDHTAAQE